MRTRSPHRSGADRLDPTGRRWPFRRGTTLRLVAVLSLLVTAAAVWFVDDGGGDRPRVATVGDATRSGDRAGPGPAAPVTAGPAASGGPGSLDPASGGPAGAGTPRLPVPDGLVGVPIRVGDPAGVAVLRSGDRVDLLAVHDGGETEPLADRAPVLAVDRPTAGLLLGLTPEQGSTVVAVRATATFTVILRR